MSHLLNYPKFGPYDLHIYPQEITEKMQFYENRINYKSMILAPYNGFSGQNSFGEQVGL
jgi:hypothetical protein